MDGTLSASRTWFDDMSRVFLQMEHYQQVEHGLMICPECSYGGTLSASRTWLDDVSLTPYNRK